MALIEEHAQGEGSLDRCIELRARLSSRVIPPDAFIVKVRNLLASAQSGDGNAPPKTPESTSRTVTDAAATVPRRKRTADLETKQEREQLLVELSRDLTRIHQGLNDAETLDQLKARYPDLRVWQMLHPADKPQLARGEFTPRAFARRLVMAHYALTNEDALRKGRRKLRQAGAQAGSPS